MPGLKATTVSLQKKTATPVSGIAVKPRAIKITKKIEKTFRSMPTEGWIHIIPSDGKWKVRKYGAVRASGVYDKLETAIAAAELADRYASLAAISASKNREETQRLL